MSSEDEISAAESDSESEYEQRPKKRNRKNKSKKGLKRLKNQFLEVEADSADENEESDEGEMSESQMKEYEKLYQVGRTKNPLFDPDVDAMKQAREFEERAKWSKIESDTTTSNIAQRRLLPSIDDPKLWLVSCRKGKTQEAAINIMQKALHMQAEGRPLKIFSAFASSHLDDRIYVEAYQKLHVTEAISGMHILFDNRTTIVPMEEMADVFAMDQVRKVTAKPGDFVRIKSGDYKGDLAQIWRLDEQRGKAVVKVVPRLGKTIGRVRPAPRMFNPQEYPNCERKMDSKSREFFHYYNGMQFQDGFMFKTMSIKSLNFDNVNPELAEVESFKNRTGEGEEAALPLTLGTSRKVMFEKSDKVQVIRGDMTNLVGHVISVTGDRVTVKPDLEGFEDALEFNITDIVKCFDIGDHVAVVSGRYKGQSGMITSTLDMTAQVMSDVTKDLLPVLFQDLQLSVEIASLPVSAEGNQYKVYDVITLNAERAFGIIVKVENSSLRVIMSDGASRVIRFSEVGKKYDPKRAQASDLEGNALNLGDMVRIVFSKHPFYEKTGAIRNAFSGILFLYNTYFVSTDSIMPVKAQFCALLGAQSDLMASSYNAISDWVGRLVSINNGPYRGQTGRVTSCTDKMVTIQLNSASKTITIERNAVTALEKGDIGMRVEAIGEFAKTPAHSPGWARTPAYDDASSPWRATPGRDFARSPSANRAYR